MFPATILLHQPAGLLNRQSCIPGYSHTIHIHASTLKSSLQPTYSCFLNDSLPCTLDNTVIQLLTLLGLEKSHQNAKKHAYFVDNHPAGIWVRV